MNWKITDTNKDGKHSRILKSDIDGLFARTWELPTGRVNWSVYYGRGKSQIEIDDGYEDTLEAAQIKAEAVLNKVKPSW